MKKLVVLISIFSIFLCNLVGQNNSNNMVAVVPLFENVDDVQSSYLGSYVIDRLQSNLEQYTQFSFLDNETKKEVLKLQRRNPEFNATSAMDIGTLSGASFGIYVTISALEESYAISSKFVNLLDGEVLVSTDSITRTKKEDLADTYGCAVDELTIMLCKQLDYPLSALDEYVLMNGEVGLNDESKLTKLNNDAKRYNIHLANLSKEIKALNGNEEVDTPIKLKNLQADFILTKGKLAFVNSRIEAVNKKLSNIKEEELKDEERSDAQKINLKQSIVSINDKISANTLVNDSFITDIRYTENIKRVFEEVGQDALIEKDMIVKQGEQDIADKKVEIESRPLRNLDKSVDGNITYAAQEKRDKELNAYAEDVYGVVNKKLSDIDKRTDNYQKKLVRDINNSYTTFFKKTITTLGEELIVDISDYDHKRHGWDLFITIQNDDEIFFETKSFLTYQSVTGEKPASKETDENHALYVNNVDFYDSLFRRGVPIFTFAMDLKIKPLDIDYPSEYSISIEDFRYYETLNLKDNGTSITSLSKDKPHLRNSYTEYQMKPVYDIRTLSYKVKEEKAVAVKIEKKEKQDAKKEEEVIARKMKEKKKRDLQEERENRVYKRDLLVLQYSLFQNEPKNMSLGIEYSDGIFEHMYWNYKFNLYNIRNVPSSHYPVMDDSFNPMLENMFMIGTNWHFGSIIQAFASFGFGFNFSFPSTVFSDFGSMNQSYFDEKCRANFTYGFSVGVTAELFRHFVLEASYNTTYFFDPKDYKYDTWNFGIGYMF